MYENTRLAVARILGDGRRQRTRVFSELVSHYLFEDRFGRPGKGNDKGNGVGAAAVVVLGYGNCSATVLKVKMSDRRVAVCWRAQRARESAA